MPHFLLPIWLCRPRLWEREPGLGRLHGRLSCQAEKSIKVWLLPVRRLRTSASLLPRPPQEIRVIGFPFSKRLKTLSHFTADSPDWYPEELSSRLLVDVDFIPLCSFFAWSPRSRGVPVRSPRRPVLHQSARARTVAYLRYFAISFLDG